MKSFCYYELTFVPQAPIKREKMLLVCDSDNNLVEKYNLTRLGLENINDYEGLKKLFGPEYYTAEELTKNFGV